MSQRRKPGRFFGSETRTGKLLENRQKLFGAGFLCFVSFICIKETKAGVQGEASPVPDDELV